MIDLKSIRESFGLTPKKNKESIELEDNGELGCIFQMQLPDTKA